MSSTYHDAASALWTAAQPCVQRTPSVSRFQSVHTTSPLTELVVLSLQRSTNMTFLQHLNKFLSIGPTR